MSTYAAALGLDRTVRSLGAALPKHLADLIAAGIAIDAAFDAIAAPATDLNEAITSGNTDTETLTALVGDAVDRHARRAAAREIASNFSHIVGLEFRNAIRGDAGARLIRGIRPKFDRAATAIASAPFSPDTAKDAAAILAAGDAAAGAWRELPMHRATLDSIFRELITPLQNSFTAPTDDHWDRMLMPLLSWVIDGDYNADLAKATHIYFDQQAGHGPGGMWHALHNAGFTLKLNTPAEARAVQQQYLDGLESEKTRHEQRAKEATAKHLSARERAMSA